MPPVKINSFFDGHVPRKKRAEQAVIDKGFAYWTVLRPTSSSPTSSSLRIQFGYTETKRSTWAESLTASSLLEFVDHVDEARSAAAAFQDPTTSHGRKSGMVSEEHRVQDAMNQPAEEIGDGGSIKVLFHDRLGGCA